MNDRLLTDEEIRTLVRVVPTESELGLAAIARRAQDARTLQEVGEWLKGRCTTRLLGEIPIGYHFHLTIEEMASLLQGELPEGELPGEG